MKSKAKERIKGKGAGGVKSQSPTPAAIAFVCNRVFLPNFVNKSKLNFIPVSCIGQVDAGMILNVLEQTGRAVVLIGCAESECRHQIGPKTGQGQVEKSQEVLRLLGFSQDLVSFVSGEKIKELREIWESVNFCSEAETGSRNQGVTTENQGPIRTDFVCLDCGRCSGICPIARTGLGFSPRRLIQQALQSQTAVSTRSLYACLGCELCRTVCPSGRSFAEEVLKLRAVLFNNGRRPVMAHTGIIQTLGRIMAKSEKSQQRRSWLDPSLRVRDKGEIALFIGCLPYFAVIFKELGVNPLKTARNAVFILNRLGVEPVILADERCCGHDLLWLGDNQTVQKLAQRNLSQLHTAGVKTVLFLCPECLRTFKLDYPKIVGATDLKLLHLTEFLAGVFVPKKGSGKMMGGKKIVTYQDPCRLARHLGVYDAPREILNRMGKIELKEMAHHREDAICCGGGSFIECGAAVKEMQKRRINEAQATGAELLITACSKCEIHLRCATLGMKEADSLKITNIIDLISPEQ